MITVVGLGPGEKNMLLPQAHRELKSGKLIYARTKEHPIFQENFPIAFESFDTIYEESKDFDQVYKTIVERLIELGKNQDIIYAVPGNPYVAEKTVDLLLESDINIKVVPGVSFLDPMLGALRIDPAKGLQIVDALDRIRLDPEKNTIVLQLYSRKVASDVKVRLEDYFTDEHPVKMVYQASTKNEKIVTIPLYELDRQKEYGHLLSLFIPGIEESHTLDDLVDLVDYLIGPDGCPWDKIQTHESLKPYLLEESLEVLEAVDREDFHELEEELGDVLFQVIFHSQLARKEGYFTIHHVLETVIEKMKRRHSHLFQKDCADTEEEVLDLWSKNKEKEKSLPEQLKDVPRIDIFYMVQKTKKIMDKINPNWTEELSSETRRFITEYGSLKGFDVNLRQEMKKIIDKYASLQKKP